MVQIWGWGAWWWRNLSCGRCCCCYFWVNRYRNLTTDTFIKHTLSTARRWWCWRCWWQRYSHITTTGTISSGSNCFLCQLLATSERHNSTELLQVWLYLIFNVTNRCWYSRSFCIGWRLLCQTLDQLHTLEEVLARTGINLVITVIAPDLKRTCIQCQSMTIRARCLQQRKIERDRREQRLDNVKRIGNPAAPAHLMMLQCMLIACPAT